MAGHYIKLEGNDLGVFTGHSGGIGFYKPANDLVPSRTMNNRELEKCLEGSNQVEVPFRTIRQVVVDGQSVWKNRDCYDLAAEGIKAHLQLYKGRGDVALELRTDVEGVEELIDEILAVDIGLRKIG